MVGEPVQQGDCLVVVLSTSELTRCVVLLLGVARDGVGQLPKLCLLGQNVEKGPALSLDTSTVAS